MRRITFERIYSDEDEWRKIEFLRRNLDHNGDTCSIVVRRNDVLIRLRVMSFCDLAGNKSTIVVRDVVSELEALIFLTEDEDE